MRTLCFEGNFNARMRRYKEFCHEQVEGVLGEFMKRFCNTWLEEEYSEQSGARMYERTESRQDYRAGHYERTLITTRGVIKVKVPRGFKRQYSYSLFKKYQRRTLNFDEVVVSALLQGHSSRKAQTFFKKLLGEATVSHQTAVATLRRFDERVAQWKGRRLKSEVVVLVLDAVYFKGVAEHLKTSKPVLFAYAVYGDGHEEVVGFELGRGESTNAWSRFCLKLHERGLTDVQLVVHDDCEAIEQAVSLAWPKALSQQCVFHVMQNFIKKLTGCEHKKALIRDASWLFEAQSREEFYRWLSEFKSKWSRYQRHGAIRYFLKQISSTIEYFGLPRKFWRIAKTTNRLERLFEEFKRRTKVFRRFPNAASCERWLYALLTLNHKADLAYYPLQSQQDS